MIHLVTPQNRHLYAAALLQMHRLRKAIFVDELGWPLQVRPDGGEYDEYDDERSLYLVGFDEDGRIEIGMRLRPTDDGKCMIANHFPHLVGPDEPSVCAVGVWEGSRIMSVPELRTSQAARKRNRELQLATIEAAAHHGITRVLGLIETFWLEKMKRALWRTRTIGPSAPHDGGEIIAFEIDSSLDAVREARMRMGEMTALAGPLQGAHRCQLELQA